MGIFYEELGALYNAALEGQACELAPLPIQYADFAAWQAARLDGELLQAQLGYWARQLAGAPPLLELPTDLPRPAVRGGAAGYARLRVPADVSQRLRDVASRAGATMFMLVLAAWQVRSSALCPVRPNLTDEMQFALSPYGTALQEISQARDCLAFIYGAWCLLWAQVSAW